jgi:hypothetical protein
MDETLQKQVEPHSSTTSERFKALKKFKELGCTTGVMAMPLLPGIGDNKENIEKIISKSSELGLDYIIFAGLTLKSGNKEIVYEFIQKNFPHLSEVYHAMYDNADKFGSPNFPENYEQKNFMKIAHDLCKKYDIPDRIPRYLPPDSNKTNLRVSEILHNLQYLKQWILRENWYKAKIYSDAAKIIENYPKDIKGYSLEELKEIEGINKKIYNLIYKIINKNIVDYTSLRI